jgi:hypothetical protein
MSQNDRPYGLFTEQQLLEIMDKISDAPQQQDAWAAELKRRNLAMVMIPSLVRRFDFTIVAMKSRVGDRIQYTMPGGT